MGKGATAFKHQVLPLTYIAKIIVVQENHLHRCLLLHNCTQFLDIHLETAITEETADGSVWSTKGSTDSCRKTEAHGTKSTTGNNTQFLGKLEIAATDHLVLTYVVHENSLIMGSFRHHIGHLAHQQRTLCRMDIFFDHLLLLLLAINIE